MNKISILCISLSLKCYSFPISEVFCVPRYQGYLSTRRLRNLDSPTHPFSSLHLPKFHKWLWIDSLVLLYSYMS
ncbi:hypothetical protein B0T10DRAFT_48203 [Thelonectria olida]|uniref:Uncharacterized protein n=1 Tax=Thelonectria olida TaxID=1576542 RepID=A0A9P9AQ25_9HYPO|nr:hypothetical protein B0T10DRAFT_48203 [Thelonectria olida]